MHGADPLPHEVGIHHAAACGDPRPDHAAHEHVWLELALGVRHVDAYLDCARRWIQHRFYEGDPAAERFTRIGLRDDLDRLAVSEPHQVRFVGVQLDPDGRQVGDGVDPRAGLDVHPLLGVLGDDDAAHGSVDRDVVRRFADLFDLRYLLFRQAPEPQSLSRCFNRRSRRLLHDADVAVRQFSNRFESLEEFRLSDQEIRTVDLHHVVALADRQTGVVHEEPVQPSGYPGGNVAELRLVVVHLADHPDLGGRVAPLHGAGPDLHQFLRGGAGDENPLAPFSRGFTARE